MACEPISDYACFLHLCVSPYFPAHLGAADSDRREGSTDVQLELTGLISKEVIWGNHLFQGCYPSSEYFLELLLESVVPALDSLNDTEAALYSFSAESRGRCLWSSEDHRGKAHGLTGEENSLDLITWLLSWL